MAERKTLTVAKKCGVSETLIYRIAKKIEESEGEWRCPTVREVKARNKKIGRPRTRNY